MTSTWGISRAGLHLVNLSGMVKTSYRLLTGYPCLSTLEVFHMKYSLSTGSLVAATLLVGSALAAELQSGPQPGKNIPGAFNPLHCNGPDTGKKVCLV